MRDDTGYADFRGRQPRPAPLDGARCRPTRLARLGRALRETLCRIAGMPDYDGYLEHWRRCHPDRPAPSRAEFFERYLESRYGSGVGRCC
jgi:uncharacterized short protein YbdD (DUF466 family)